MDVMRLWLLLCLDVCFADDFTLMRSVSLALDQLLKTYDKSVRPGGEDEDKTGREPNQCYTYISARAGVQSAESRYRVIKGHQTTKLNRTIHTMPLPNELNVMFYSVTLFSTVEGPLIIKTNMLVRSMGPITETKMAYSLQCYLRQSWYDQRLKFDLDNITEVTLSNTFLKDIWKPNTYFLNGRLSTQPNITVPNVFVRIRKDGSIYMSRRLTLNAGCPLNLMNYPMDEPVCPLLLAGYGYTTDEVIYQWQAPSEAAVDIYDDVTLLQFDIVSIWTKNNTYSNAIGTYSGLEVHFHLRRHIGFFMLQTYLPCTLIVCLSWVSFWINRDAAPARVLLGVTTILSTAAVGLVQRDSLPRVPYATALDLFLNVCIFYNLAAIVQYAAVNYFTKILPKEGGLSEDEDEEMNNSISGNDLVAWKVGKSTQTMCPVLFCKCLLGNFRFRNKMVETADVTSGNSVSSIDIWSRYLFPCSFGLFQAFYWTWFLRLTL